MNLRRWRIGIRLFVGYAVILLLALGSAEVMQQTGGGSWHSLAVSLLMLAVGALMCWRLTVSITRPLQLALSVARRVANGDLTSRATDSGSDEVGELVAALAKMNRHLLGIVGDVRGTSDSIAVTAREIASGNADLSARTEAQASALEQTAAAMEELAATVAHNAAHAERAGTLAKGSSEVAARGGATVAAVVSVMGEIGIAAREVREITNVVESIAFQTNILAINAAIEAASAGENGRGFSIIAAEVRNLAMRSTEAARQINALVSAAVARVDEGSRLVVVAGQTMGEIVGAVDSVTTLMTEIALSSGEQRAGIDGINQALISIDGMTQQNAALVEQAAAASEGMQERAVLLAGVVRLFRLESNTREAIAMVKRAETYVAEHGRAAALAAFNAPDPAFKSSDLYISVTDLNGITLAHGDNPSLVGKNLTGLTDADGKPFIREFLRAASSKRQAWVDYRWANPVTGVVEAKSTYVCRVNDLVIGCGIYK
jgi:methyl-accepting chemotaxis protein